MLEVEIAWGGENHRFELENGAHRVGRSGENDIQIPLPRVSKQHAVLRVDETRLFVRDLGSSNGTEINGRPIGDGEVEVPRGSIVSFAGALLRRAGQVTTAVHRLAEGNLNTPLKYDPSEGLSNAARDRIVKYSSELFELLASGKNASEVANAACRFVAGCVEADRVVLLEDEGEATTVEARANWVRNGDPNAPLQLSSSIVGEVLQERASVLVANMTDDPRFGGQQSIMALNLRSAMAAPLFDNQRVRGILYVDTARAGVHYGKADLEVLTAAANAVAVKLRNISFEREMRTAAKIQRAMLPAELNPPAGYELEAHQVMCHAVGGDLYHCARRPDGNVIFALGDVSGKGMPAALAMGAATVLIGMLAEIEADLDTLAGHLHRQLFRSLAAEQFITLFLAELDGQTGVLRYVNAGHEPPLLLRKGGEVEALDSTGLPVAMIEEAVSQSAEVRMEPGDLLAVFSDGIPEATTNGEDFLGLEPVQELLAVHRGDALGDIRKRIVDTVDAFLAGDSASDDVTLLLLRRCDG